MKIIITEDQSKQIRSFMRRINIADKIISELDPKDVCAFFANDDRNALLYADDVIANIVWEINETFGLKSYDNKDLYKFFENFGYYDKLIKFFHNAMESCE